MVNRVLGMMPCNSAKGSGVRINEVTFFAGEDLKAGALVERRDDGLIYACSLPTIAPTFTDDYVDETVRILSALDFGQIETLASYLACVETVYVVGHGGSAATASHAANDLRKLCGKKAICPTDNVSLMTALANDYSFDTWLVEWFALEEDFGDAAFLFLSVGGGNGKTSRALTMAAHTLKLGNYPVLAIVGRDGGELAKLANCAVVIPNMFPEHVTPHVEGLTSVLLHLLVTHPSLAKHAPTWRT